jgi:hypothetical protein
MADAVFATLAPASILTKVLIDIWGPLLLGQQAVIVRP